jgi:hypothetical protein
MHVNLTDPRVTPVANGSNRRTTPPAGYVRRFEIDEGGNVNQNHRKETQSC